MRADVAARSSAFALGVALALGGCNVGPRYQRPPVSLPETWSAEAPPVPIEPESTTPAATPPEASAVPPAPEAATPATIDGEWWTVFGDPALDRLVDLANQQNLPLQVAGLRIAEARAQLAVAVGSQFPQHQVVFADATAIGISGNTPLGRVIDRHFVDYQVGFDASWEADLWGRYRRGVEAQNEVLLASASDYHFAQVSVTAETARVYTTIRTFEALIALAVDNTRIQSQGLEIAESRARNGATSELDVVQQRTLLESTRATVPHLQIGLQQSRNALAVLLGLAPDELDELLAGPARIPQAPVEVAVGVPADILRRRPDVLAAEHEAAAQSARVGIAEAELYPMLALAGTIGLEASSGAGVENEWDESPFYEAGPRLTWNFFEYGRTRNSVRVEDARYQQLLVGYQDAVLRAARDVEDALTSLTSSRNAQVFEEASVAAAQQALDIAMVQYREGAVDFQRVLDAQRSLLDQQNTLAQTRSDVATSLIALYKALGGGWETRRDEPVVRPAIQQEMEERTNWGDLLSAPAEP